jgi:hypothetical protein
LILQRFGARTSPVQFLVRVGWRRPTVPLRLILLTGGGVPFRVGRPPVVRGVGLAGGKKSLPSGLIAGPNLRSPTGKPDRRPTRTVALFSALPAQQPIRRGVVVEEADDRGASSVVEW